MTSGIPWELPHVLKTCNLRFYNAASALKKPIRHRLDTRCYTPRLGSRERKV